MADKLKPGDKVIMVNCMEARMDKYKGKVFTVRSEPWNLCGTEAVLLEGKSGGFATEFLYKVDTNCIGLSVCGGGCESCPAKFPKFEPSNNNNAEILKRALNATSYPGGMAKNIRQSDAIYDNIYEFELQSIDTKDVGDNEVIFSAVYKRTNIEAINYDS